MESIAIIGSGITGLSTAYHLQARGYRVKIISSAFPPDTTSNKAAAFWFPFHIQNDKRCIAWASLSYAKYMALSDEPAAGIRSCQLIKMVSENTQQADMKWIDFMPEASCRPMEKSELKEGYRLGHAMKVPLIETHIFLPWLMRCLSRKGVEFIQQEIKDLAVLTNQYKWVINCSGLGARELCTDDSIFPVRGQVGLLSARDDMPIVLDDEQPFYLVPRKDGLIIGGTYEEGVWDTTPDRTTIQGLYQQAVSLFPELDGASLIDSWSGLRPFRYEIKLEQERAKRIIHNYGHGGNGFTLAWGCAEEVERLISQ
jgi:D-amino-acid oxidase